MKKIVSSLFAIVMALNLYITIDDGANSELASAIIQPNGDELIEGEY